jgi:hypothetical protein
VLACLCAYLVPAVPACGAAGPHSGAGRKPSGPTRSRVAKNVTLAVRPGSTSLESGKETTVFLVIRNKGETAVHLGRTELKGSDFITIDEEERLATAPPGVSVQGLTVKAADSVSPGKQEVAFVVPVRGGERVDLVATEELQVGVVGETALLTALGVPSLLLIPGFLFLATFMLFWRVRLFRPAWDTNDSRLGPTDAEFWVVTVGASIAILGGARLVGTDLFETYGIEDLILLWVASFALGLAAYLAVVVARRVAHRLTALSAKDDPVTVLRKLDRAHLGLSLPRAICSVGSKEVTLYRLEGDGAGRAAAWMAPAIVCVIPADGEMNDSMNELAKAIDDGATARRVAGIISKGKKAKQLEVRWSADARPLRGPRQIDEDDVRGSRSPESLVEVRSKGSGAVRRCLFFQHPHRTEEAASIRHYV